MNVCSRWVVDSHLCCVTVRSTTGPLRDQTLTRSVPALSTKLGVDVLRDVRDAEGLRSDGAGSRLSWWPPRTGRSLPLGAAAASTARAGAAR